MAKIRKINVSEIVGINPPSNGDAVMPAGTIVVYEINNNGVIDYVLRVHDGVTDGGVPFPNAPSIEHNNDINITIDNDDSSTYTWNFGQTGDLTAPGDITTGLDGSGGRFIQDCADGTTSMRWINVNQGSSNIELIRAYTGDPKLNTEVERAQIKLNWDQTEDKSGLTIRTFDQSNPNSEVDHDWLFKGDGVLQLPVGGDIVDSNGDSVLGGVDNNIWIQTFASQDGFPSDVVGLATSVEYDNTGNIIALFSHQTGIGDFNIPTGSYFSVAKFSATGDKLWQVRLAAGMGTGVYTDGWGLAVDNVDGRIYVAGRIDDEVGYSRSSLIKLNSEDGSLIWSNVYDFGDRSDSPVVDVDSDGNPVMVGYFSTDVEDNDGITVTKISKLDGTVVWSRLLDGQGDDEAYGMAVGPTGEVVAVGYMDLYDEPLSHSVTPLVGSGVNVLVINRSDLSGDTLTDTWEVSGTGITGTIGVNAINVYTGLTGTVRQGAGAVFEIGDNGLGAYTAAGIQNNGTNYLPGHKILVLGTDLGGATPANDCIITVDSVTEGGLIFNWSVTGTAAGVVSALYGPVTGTNYQTGSGLTFNFFGDSGSTYTEHFTEITAAGSNYVLDDVITISGALLGGTTPENDLIGTVNANLGAVVQFMTFSGSQQTTTYRVRTEDGGPDFSGEGTWTLSGVLVDNDDRMLVVKYDSTGAIQWQKAIQFDAGYACRGADADIDSQGNVYVCGNYDYDAGGDTNSAMNLIKFDSSGVKQWSRRVAGPCEDFATSIVVGPDDTLYLSGVTGSLVNDTPRYVWVVAKYTTSGAVVWQRLIENTTGWTFGGAGFFNNGGGSNLAVGEGYVALSGGFGEPFFGISSATVVQIDTDGTVFTVGDWEVKPATFSGTLNSTASDITVVDAGKVSSAITGIAVDDTLFDTDTTNFLIPTLYTAPSGDSSLVNGAYSVTLGNTGTVTLPAGGTITEGYVTSNPTIQLTPASPDVASQKLVIKGGGAYTYTDNGISINYNNNTALVGDTLTFYINSNTYADQTLYWWIYPQGAGIGDTESGTVALTSNYGDFSILIDSDDYEFTVRVSPEDNNYDPASLGVETGLINPDAPTFDSEHHLHLTTGNLAETSIFLGTDDHNVRTTVNGGIEINTFLYPSGGGSGKWTFSENGDLTFPDDTVQTTAYIPGDIQSENDISVRINLTDSTQRVWRFGEDGDLTLPGDIVKLAINEANPDGGLVVSVDTGTGTGSKSLYKFGRGGQFTSRAISVTDANGDRVGGLTGDGFGPILNAPADKEVWISTDGQHLWRFTADRDFVLPYGGGNIRSEGNINIDINLSDSTMRRWQFGEDGDLTFPDGTTQTTAFVQGEQTFIVDYGNTDYAPTAVDFNLLLVIPAIGYSDLTPTSVTLPNGVPGQRLVIYNSYNLATLTVNPGPVGRDISGGVVAEFIYSGFDGLWIPLYGTNSPT